MALVFGLVMAAGVWLGLLLADRLMGRILLAGTVVSASAVRFWVIVHLVAGLAAVLLAVLAVLASRRTRVEAEQPVPANPLA